MSKKPCKKRPTDMNQLAKSIVDSATSDEPEPEESADHALGRSRGGVSTKTHIVCDANGLPLHSKVNEDQESRPVKFDREVYRDRNVVERLIDWLAERVSPSIFTI